MNKKLISIVIPAYREQRNISHIYSELSPVIASISHYDWEIVFVNDGSTDGTWDEIDLLCGQDERVK
jgi:dolichol-phosphate mannosyltransferase